MNAMWDQPARDLMRRRELPHIDISDALNGEPMDVTQPFVERTFDIVRVVRSRLVGPFVRDSANIEIRSAPIMSTVDGSLIRELTAYVLADRLPDEQASEQTRVIVRYPGTSWQMFKHEHERSWWLAWFVRRRPVRMAVVVRTVTMTVDMRRWRVFPEARVPWPQELGNVRHHAAWDQRTRITDSTQTTTEVEHDQQRPA